MNGLLDRIDNIPDPVTTEDIAEEFGFTPSPDFESQIHDIDRLLKINDHWKIVPEVHCINACPRAAKKTTTLLNEAYGDYDTVIYFCVNHTEGAEIGQDHAHPDGEYGPGFDTIVHLKGKNRVDAYSDFDTSNARSVASSAAYYHHYVDEEAIIGATDDASPYHALIEATAFADLIIAPPEMSNAATQYIDPNDSIGVLIDEETTLNHFLQTAEPIISYSDSLGSGVSVHPDSNLAPARIDHLIDIIETDIESRDRVAQYFFDGLTIAHQIKYLADSLITRLSSSTDVTPEIFDDITVDFECPSSRALEYLGEMEIRAPVAKIAQILYSEPEIVTLQSPNGNLNVSLVPEMYTDDVQNRKLFEQADFLGLVGDNVAKRFSINVFADGNPKSSHPVDSLGPGAYIGRNQDLKLISIHGDSQREFIDAIANQLPPDIKTLYIAGSLERAETAGNATYPRKFLHRGPATLEDANRNWRHGNIVHSYMGSTITRGVDTNNDVTLVRSQRFATPSSHYEYADRYKNTLAIAERFYKNQIEAINAALRGFRPGEHHIAVVPGDLDLSIFGLEQYETRYDIDDCRPRDITAGIISELGFNPQYCPNCHDFFIRDADLDTHTCN